MNDYLHIKKEKLRANELLANTQIPGREQEALLDIMAETNHDFFYFNKVRHQKMLAGEYEPRVKEVSQPDMYQQHLIINSGISSKSPMIIVLCFFADRCLQVLRPWHKQASEGAHHSLLCHGCQDVKQAQGTSEIRWRQERLAGETKAH